MGAILKDSLEMIEGLTPYQTLGKLTSQTQTERYDICWKKGSPMTGQQLYQKILQFFSTRRTIVHQSLQGHPGENLDIPTFSRTKIKKGYASLLHHIGF